MAQQFRSTLADNRNAVGFRQIWKELVYPIIAERSSGARMWDVDGNEYLDLVMGFGVNLFGHSPHFVTEALETQLKKGIQIGPQTRLAGEVAELIRELTGMERVNFCNTGSEAVMGALRIARTVTGRNKIAIFAGSYHGISDGVLARAKTVNGTRQTVPVALGIPQQMISQVVVLDYNRPESLDYIRAHAGEFAATLVEPVQSSRPDIQPKEFLLALRELTREAGIALIFDEMVTGFRIHPGGAQAWFGIQADLATYGKIVGGGMPIGVIAGKAAYLDAIDGGTWSYGDASYPKANQTFLAGTFCKHPLALAASKAVLTHLKQTGPALQQMLNERTALITNSLNDYCQQARLPMHVRSFGSLFRLNFSHEANFGNLLFYHLLNQGIHLWEGRNCFLSTAHTDEDIRYIVQTIKQCLEELRKGDFIPCGDGRANTVQTPTAGLAAGKEGRKPDAARGASEEGTGERLLPMTDSQKGLWAVAQMSSQACAAFNETINLRLRGELDAELLRQALQRVVERHGALRTTFSQDGESQRISPSITLDTPLIDYSSVPGDEKDACLTRWFKAEAERPFDLAEGPLLRTTLIKTREREHYLALTIHHLVTDGWSVSIFQRELWAFYKALRSGQDCQLPTPYSFGDYAQAQSNDDENEGLAQAESYWIQKFAGEVPRLNLPTDRPRPRIQTYQGNRKRLVIPRELRPALNKFASSQNSTLFITLLSCFQVLLHQISGQEDIIAGIHSAGQAAMGGKHLMGFCINTLPLRNRISWDETFTDQLSRTKQDVFAAQKHQNYSLRRLVKRLQLVRDPGRPPLIPVIFNLDRSRGADSDTQIAGLEVSRIPSSTVFARFDLLWNAVETDTQLVVDCTYNTDLFDARTIEGWMDRYGKLLELVALTPKIKVAELVTALSAAESQRKYEEETNLKQARLRKFRELRKPAINSPTS
jgi:glutamate-1-semialdehyde aminotransferase